MNLPRWWIGVWAGSGLALLSQDLLDLKTLRETKVVVATGAPLSLREAPAIVSLVTADDIRTHQCRDLMDVLALIPGLQATQDVPDGSITVRGLYGFEGRTLFLVDGLPLTELYFGGFPLGNEFPVHLIERIEVIRGPGSVLYGGTAELAVIQLTTFRGSDLEGGRASVRGGRLPQSLGHQDAGLAWGQSAGELEVSLLAWGSQARVSDAANVRYGSRPDFPYDERGGGLSATATMARVKVGDTELKTLYHRYTHRFITGFSAPATTPPATLEALIRSRAEVSVFTTLDAELGHRFHAGDQWDLEPRISYQSSAPFDKLRRTDPEIARLKGALLIQGRLGWGEVRAGFEAGEDRGSLNHDPANTVTVGYRATLQDPLAEQVTIHHAAAYLDATLPLGRLNVVGGLRRDQNELYGGQTSPRFGLTWAEEAWHVKLLYADAFRAPLFANTAWNRFGLDPAKPWRREVRPERTQVLELEAGWYSGSGLSLNLNVFRQVVRDIIEFRYYATQDDLFSDNGGKLGTTGFEAEARFVGGPYKGQLGLSHARALRYPNPSNPYVADLFGASREPMGGDTYLAIHRPGELMGAAPWKLYTHHLWRLAGGRSLQASLLWLSSKNGTDGLEKTRTEAAQLILNTGFLWTGLRPGLDVDLSIHDLTNQRLKLVTPFYDGGYDTTPWKGREISVSVMYRF